MKVKRFSIFSGLLAVGLCFSSLASANRQAALNEVTSKAPGNMPTLMGCVSYADSWSVTGVGKVGIYEISPSSLKEVSLHENMLTSYGQVYAGSQYLATQPELYQDRVYNMTYNIYDTQNWVEHPVTGDCNFKARAMTFDPVSRHAYAITDDMTEYTYNFSVMDLDSYEFKVIRTLEPEDWSALMCSPEGVVYGINKSGILVKFDKTTGDYTVIGDTGLASSKMTCGTIDPESGRCFYIHYTPETSDMYEIDLSNASPTFLYPLPESAQVLSLFVPEKAAAAGSPAKASQLALSFEDKAFSGTFNFHIPDMTTGGDPLEGTVKYSVKINGKEIVNGEGKAGEDIKCKVEVPCSGEYTFAVVLSNASGSNDIATLTKWIGYQRPGTPKNVYLIPTGDQLNLFWDPVNVDGASNGEVTYTVVMYPSGDKVAEGLTSSSYFCDVPATEDLTRYYFGIVAHYGDSKSDEAISSGYVVGYLTLPYSEDFENPICMDYYTLVNSNGDNRSWEYNFFGQGQLLINYSLSSPHDDWAILHPVKLEAGKCYTIGCDAHATLDPYVEKLEIAVAKGTNAEALRNAVTVMPATSITHEEYQTYSGTFIPKESGVYYVGFHALSDVDQNKLFLDNVFITAGTSTLAPAEVKNAKAKAAASGVLAAEISFVAPKSDLAGNPLTELSYVAIEREGKELGRVNGKAGEALSFTDNNAINGRNIYTIVGYNSYGRGAEVTVETYVGLVEPMNVENVYLSYGRNTGEAVLTWTAPEYDLNGNSLEGSGLTFNIWRSINGSALLEIATGVTETSFTEQVMDTDADQMFVNYFVEAIGAGGASDLTISNMYPFGRPEQTPARESFGGRITDYEWGAESTADGFIAWDVYPTQELPFPTFDGGSVAAAYRTYDVGKETATLISSLFDLSALEKPLLSFYFYDYSDTENTLKVYVDNGKTCELVSDIQFGEAELEWKRKTIDLSAYSGQIVSIRLEATLIDYNLLAIDNLRIANDVDHNLSVLSISAPDTAEANEEFQITTLIENAGKKTAEAYTVNLLCDGQILKSAECSDLNAETLESIEFKVALPVVSVDNPEFSVEIDYPLDQEEDDNTSEKAIVRFLASSYPAPRDLSAQVENNNVILTWNEPDLNDVVLAPSVDDIESYTPFSTGLPTTWVDDDNIGEWTTIDADGLTTYVSEFSYPGVGQPMAFVVYNSYYQEDNVFACHSGHQMFLSLASRPKGDQGNDDWLISPLLAECEQTISFYAKTISADLYGPDTFQVLYSLSGKEISDFVLLKEYTSTGDWKEYLANLPEGTKYFAVRCISYDKYAFLLDDFRMITAKDAINDLEIEGYNLYCDGNRVNEALIKENSYTHTQNAEGSSTLNYNVACLFNRGESKPSETVKVTLTPSSVENVTASDIIVIGRHGELIVKGAEGKEVIVADSFGRVVYQNVADGNLRISVPAGIYLVNAGSSISKVIVR